MKEIRSSPHFSEGFNIIAACVMLYNTCKRQHYYSNYKTKWLNIANLDYLYSWVKPPTILKEKFSSQGA